MKPTPGPTADATGSVAVAPQQYSRHRLLEALRHSGGTATRTELARITGLSRATVSNAIGRLLADGLVFEVAPGPGSGAGSGRGRPAALVRLTAPSGVVIGLDFGHSHLRAAVADLAGQVLAEVYVELQVDNSPDDAIAAAATEFVQLLDSIEATAADVSGVVMGLPSPVDRDSGRIVSNNILPGWVNRTPAAELQQRIRLPVMVDNDANLAALGELTYGAGTGIRNLIYVKASTGIGAGLIFDGRLYRGSTGTAGELGHVQINPDGAVCRCGNRGCLETLVSIPHVLAALQPMHHQPLAIADVLRLVATGDVSARRVIIDVGRVIGRSLADLCNVLNPGAILVGGELSAAGEPFTAGIRDAIDRHTQPVVAQAVNVHTSALADRAEVLGAIALAIQANPAATR